uniref:GOLD domain-containing protein n=1 Tax=Dunaliella tertiolecta TaxID=3047 RepID=A0A7S3QKF9_DUNTE|mmetsp:Transcript_5513/g.14871  ORF Transcript_5513/g.14871 Transcript_5513/m.14871 type:complete len:209 (-) Transcript_5513:214-840(-)|eukprot:CAMPEP_0202353354 /NCGR_PEP_ID=MMETSP1126-20121109/9154_1 /ASSEMBLY_ACC=CAM_ASM_000457 /TAXON_ID=3047 /ORGANISM="Dunaliella tertiolecta, Strain CCMP1320" /LENGTH=208 /DNA_ID=CAMNT_0048945697 /DNA_START=52 /DNA_END=678 /DNA_ORIENTATION=+
MRGKLWVALLCCSLLCYPIHALEFEMQDKTKCIYEEVNANVLVVADYKAFNKDRVEQLVEIVNVKVEGPHSGVLYEKKDVSEGQFAFTAKIGGEYKACFSVRDMSIAQATKLRVDWKTGVAATDWSAVAKKEHLDQLSVELRKLEDSIREVYTDMLMLQQREQEMRDISEITNTRVAFYSLGSLLVCIASGVWQLWYLRKFFQRKKLL